MNLDQSLDKKILITRTHRREKLFKSCVKTLFFKVAHGDLLSPFPSVAISRTD